MPWVLAKRDFGDPFLVDTNPEDPYRGRERSNDLERLNARYGMLSSSFYSGIPSVTAEIDGDRLEPQPYRSAEEIGYTPHPSTGRFRHPNLPLIEVWTAEANPSRVFMLIDDPEGNDHRAKDRADAQVTVSDEHDSRLASLEAELAALKAQRSIVEEINDTPTPEPVKNPMAPVAPEVIGSEDDIVKVDDETMTPPPGELSEINALSPEVTDAFAPDDTPSKAHPTPKKTPARR
jgi:hypothetical protein